MGRDALQPLLACQIRGHYIIKLNLQLFQSGDIVNDDWTSRNSVAMASRRELILVPMDTESTLMSLFFLFWLLSSSSFWLLIFLADPNIPSMDTFILHPPLCFL